MHLPRRTRKRIVGKAAENYECRERQRACQELERELHLRRTTQMQLPEGPCPAGL